MASGFPTGAYCSKASQTPMSFCAAGSVSTCTRTREGMSSIVLLGFLAVAGFYLATEHTAHLLGALPFLLFLACPLMRLFMHHGHGKHGKGGSP